MDSHDIARGRGAYPDVLRFIDQPALVVGIDSDVLYPLREQEELAHYMPRAELRILSAIHGHDSFLIELEALNDLVRGWMSRQLIVTPGPEKALCP